MLQAIGGKRIKVSADSEVQLSSAHKRNFFECVESQTGTPYSNDSEIPRCVIVLGGGKIVSSTGRWLQFNFTVYELGLLGFFCSITPMRIPPDWEGEIWAVNTDAVNDSYIHYVEY
jgi:hypothetical protein